MGFVRASSTEMTIHAALDAVPHAVMLMDVRTFLIEYVNPASKTLLHTISNLLKINPDNIVGTSVDVFHKHPEHQRRILADVTNLPHKARIKLGDELLDLHITPAFSKAGYYVKAMLTWNVVTEMVHAKSETERLMKMIDTMPINVMSCERDTLEINYLNQTSINTLKGLQEYLPLPAESLKGNSIDIFHKHPEHQRKLLQDPSNLPHRAKIKLGPEVLDLQVSAMFDDRNNYIGPMLTWAVITENVRLADKVSAVSAEVTADATAISGASTQLRTAAELSGSNSSQVAAAAEEMSASSVEIAEQIGVSAKRSAVALEKSRESKDRVATLSGAAKVISGVVELIEDIASRTNLLALNATIEAARAGQAGKGFAVVAHEVKNLAKQTGTATSQIRIQIDDMLSATNATVSSIDEIDSIIVEINEVAAQISAAVEEQTVSISQVTQNIVAVSDAADETREAADSLALRVDTILHRAKELETDVSAYRNSN